LAQFSASVQVNDEGSKAGQDTADDPEHGDDAHVGGARQRRIGLPEANRTGESGARNTNDERGRDCSANHKFLVFR
jgi:hypothetical protein